MSHAAETEMAVSVRADRGKSLQRSVAVVGPAYPFRGGIAHYTACLASQLAQRGNEVQVINYRTLYPKVLFPGKTMFDESSEPITANQVQLLHPLLPWTWLSACRQIRRMKADRVVIQWWHVYFSLCLLSIALLCRHCLRVPVAVLCHNVEDHEKHAFLTWLATRMLVKSGVSIIVHSQADAEILRQKHSAKTIFVTQHPTYEVFRHDYKMKHRNVRQELGITAKRVCLFFGFIRKYKGLEDLIVAMSLTKSDPHLLVVGEFYEPIEPYKQMIDKLKLRDRATIVDRYVPNEEVEAYFRACDVLVAPYRSASQSGVVRIANALAVPAIVTAVGGLPEMVAERETGLIIPPQSPSQLAAAIDEFFCNNLSDQFQLHLRAQSHRYSWDTLNEYVEQLSVKASS